MYKFLEVSKWQAHRTKHRMSGTICEKDKNPLKISENIVNYGCGISCDPFALYITRKYLVGTIGKVELRMRKKAFGLFGQKKSKSIRSIL